MLQSVSPIDNIKCHFLDLLLCLDCCACQNDGRYGGTHNLYSSPCNRLRNLYKPVLHAQGRPSLGPLRPCWNMLPYTWLWMLLRCVCRWMRLYSRSERMILYLHWNFQCRAILQSALQICGLLSPCRRAHELSRKALPFWTSQGWPVPGFVHNDANFSFARKVKS